MKKNNAIHFATVDYDNQIFKDYVINQIKRNKNGLETESIKRIVEAFDFFSEQLKVKDEIYLKKIVEAIKTSSCTTHIVKNESEAIQMFLFQNNRGKKPSNLEVIKAQFMFKIHLLGGDEKENLINEIKNRFETIYKAISSIEYKISEDEVLTYTLRVYFNSLWEDKPIEKINRRLAEDNSVHFIREFTIAIAESFEYLNVFFGEDERNNFEVHSLISLGRIGIAIPFIIKAYKAGLNQSRLSRLCNSLENLILRHRLIGTKADLITRINNEYAALSEEDYSFSNAIARINYLKVAGREGDFWFAHWNNEALARALKGKVNHSAAKFLLWKYENFLKQKGKRGYKSMRYNDIISPELEHIAPQTEPYEKHHGYGKYTEAFKKEFLNCLGNYLLVSKSHNCSVGNVPFSIKHKSYNYLEQQREIQKLVSENGTWGTKAIRSRREKIIKFIIDKYQ